MSTTVDGQVYTRAPVPVTLIAPTDTLSAYPALIILTPNATVYNASNSLLSDWRFTANSNGSGLLYHQYMSGTNAAGNAMFWVNVTTLTTGTNIIYLWYGASGQTQQTTAWQANTWNSNYGMVLHLDETGTNPTVHSSTSNALTSATNLWTPTAGQIGGSAGFSTNQHIDFTDNAALRPTSSVTISFLFKLTTLSSSTECFFIKGTGTDSNICYEGIYNRASPSHSISFEINSAAGTLYIATSAAITTTGWHYYVGKYDGANAIIKIDDVKTVGQALTGASYSSTQNLKLGYLYGSYYFVNGNMDEFRIESDATSDAWDTYSYNTMSSATGAVSSVTWPSAGMTAQQMARGMF